MKVYRFRLSCNCCKLNETCQAGRVTTRAGQTIPGCIPATPQISFCEANNVDEKITDVAEKIHEFRDRVNLGGFTPDGIRWIPAMSERERRQAYINYGLIKPTA